MSCGCAALRGLGAVDPCQAQIDKVKGLTMAMQANQSVLQSFPPGTAEAVIAPLRDLHIKSRGDLAAGQVALSQCQNSGSKDYTVYYILGGVAVLGALAYWKTKGRF